MESTEILDGINLLLIIAIGQGLLITLLLFHKHAALYPNRFLGFLMLIFSLSLLHVYLSERGFYDEAIIGFILLSVIFMVGPLHFFYTKYLIHQPKKFRRVEWFHFIPSAVFVLFIVFVHYELIPLRYQRALLLERDSGLILFNWIYVIQVLIYYIFALRELSWYSSRIRDVFSSIDEIRLQWLKQLTYLAMGIMLIFLTENVLNILGINITNFHLSSVLAAVYVYGMGYLGISKTIIFNDPAMQELTHDLPDDYDSQKESRTKYERSGLSDKQAEESARLLNQLMLEKEVYRNSNLTLKQLANLLSISSHHLSEVINSHLNQNFFDFINRFRVNHVINNLTNDDKKHLTILALGLEGGFNSKTTFNTIFKKFTGKTPSQYRNELRQAT